MQHMSTLDRMNYEINLQKTVAVKCIHKILCRCVKVIREPFLSDDSVFLKFFCAVKPSRKPLVVIEPTITGIDNPEKVYPPSLSENRPFPSRCIRNPGGWVAWMPSARIPNSASGA